MNSVRFARHCLLVVVCLLLTTGLSVQAQTLPRFEPVACWFDPPPGWIAGDNLDCGYVVVPESRAGEASREVRIAVVRLRYLQPDRQADPVIFVHDNPGIPMIAAAIDRVTTLRRDVMLVNLRGIWPSEPVLNCPDITEQIYLETHLSPANNGERYISSLQACRERLLTHDNDLSAYTTRTIAADINDIRLAFGYEMINLWANSYTTTVALVVMRDFPEIVRSAVLDSAVPPPVNPLTDIILSRNASLRLIVEHCNASLSCSDQYPDLETKLGDLVARLNVEPAIVTVINPFSGDSQRLPMSGDGFANLLLDLSADTRFFRELPMMINMAYQGDYAPMLQAVTPQLYSHSGRSEALHYAVLCESEYPFTSYDEAVILAQTLPSAYQDGALAQVRFDLDICAGWNIPAAPPTENESIQSDIPALLILGTYDPFTPLAMAVQMASQLSNSVIATVPEVAHGAATASSCTLSIVDNFVLNPSQSSDTSCLFAASPDELDQSVQITQSPPPSTTPAGTYTTAATFQPFENGFMIWRADNSEIFVYVGGYAAGGIGQLTIYPVSQYASLPSQQYQPPAGRWFPEFGFGSVWSSIPGVREQLGWALSGEQGFTMSIQPANNRVISFSLPDDRHFVCGDGSNCTINRYVQPSATARPTTAPPPATPVEPGAANIVSVFSADPNPAVFNGPITLSWEAVCPQTCQVYISRLDFIGRLTNSPEIPSPLPAIGNVAVTIPSDYTTSVSYVLTTVNPDGSSNTTSPLIVNIQQKQPADEPAPVPVSTESVFQSFERGFMVRNSGTNCAYVYSNVNQNIILGPGGSYHYCIEYDALPDIPGTDVPPDGLIVPVGAFGRIWYSYENVREALGWATAPDQSYTGQLPPPESSSGGGPFSMPQAPLPDGRVLYCGTRGATAGTCSIR